MDTQHLSTYQAMDRRHALARVEEIASNLLPERAVQVGKVDLRRFFLENVLEHRAVPRAGAPVQERS